MTAQEKARMISGMIFVPITTPEIIPKYFKRIRKKYIILLTELLAYRIFVADFTLYTFYGHTPTYQTVKTILIDKYVAGFWNDAFSKGLLAHPPSFLNVRMTDFAQLYKSSHAPDNPNVIGYACARILKNAELKTNIDFMPDEYLEFQLKYFVPSISELESGIHRIMSGDAEKQENTSSCMGCITLIIIAGIIYLILK